MMVTLPLWSERRQVKDPVRRSTKVGWVEWPAVPDVTHGPRRIENPPAPGREADTGPALSGSDGGRVTHQLACRPLHAGLACRSAPGALERLLAGEFGRLQRCWEAGARWRFGAEAPGKLTGRPRSWRAATPPWLRRGYYQAAGGPMSTSINEPRGSAGSAPVTSGFDRGILRAVGWTPRRTGLGHHPDQSSRWRRWNDASASQRYLRPCSQPEAGGWAEAGRGSARARRLRGGGQTPAPARLPAAASGVRRLTQLVGTRGHRPPAVEAALVKRR